MYGGFREHRGVSKRYESCPGNAAARTELAVESGSVRSGCRVEHLTDDEIEQHLRGEIPEGRELSRIQEHLSWC